MSDTYENDTINVLDDGDEDRGSYSTVSYTHLTLPTIYSV